MDLFAGAIGFRLVQGEDSLLVLTTKSAPLESRGPLAGNGGTPLPLQDRKGWFSSTISARGTTVRRARATPVEPYPCDPRRTVFAPDRCASRGKHEGMAELIPGVFYQEFVSEALLHRSEQSFRASPFFRKHGEELLRLLSTPRIQRRGASPTPAGSPPHPSIPSSAPTGHLRLVQWNIEKGCALQGLRMHLTTHPFLSRAEVLVA